MPIKAPSAIPVTAQMYLCFTTFPSLGCEIDDYFGDAGASHLMKSRGSAIK